MGSSKGQHRMGRLLGDFRKTGRSLTPSRERRSDGPQAQPSSTVPIVPSDSSPFQNSTKLVQVRQNTSDELDIWQEALDAAKKSKDWADHQQEYDRILDQMTIDQNNLTRGQGKSGSRTIADAISQKLDTIVKQKEIEQWKFSNSKGETVIVRDVISQVARWLNVFKEQGNTLASMDPTKGSAVIWGFIQFFVETTIKYEETRAFATDQEPIAKLISKFKIVERIYLHDTSSMLNTDIEKVHDDLVDLYKSILLYQFAIYRYLEKRKLKQVLQCHVSERLKEMAKDIKTKSEDLEGTLRNIDSDRLRAVWKIVDGQIREMDCQLQEIYSSLQHDKLSEVLRWVSPILHEDHRSSVKPMDGTGQWLLEHEKFKDWKVAKKSGLFWLRGNVGTGKTNLVSVVISHLLDLDNSLHNRVVYFFINRTDRESETKDAGTALKSLLKQLAIASDTRIFQPVYATYEKNRNSSSLQLEECITLMSHIIKHSRQVTVVIDALDELPDDDVQSTLLKSLAYIANSCQKSESILKIFVSSRDNPVMERLVQKFWPVSIRCDVAVLQQNQEDIKKFIEEKVDEFAVKKTFLGGLLPSNVRRDLKKRLEKKSGAMFRWVSLSIAYLGEATLIDPNSILNRLDEVPQDLMDAYSQLLASIERSLSSELANVVRRVLTWIMYARHEHILAEGRFPSVINYYLDRKRIRLSVTDILNLCSAFIQLGPIRRESMRKFGFIHLSVKEFLERQPDYAADKGNALIAQECLEFLNNSCNLEFQHRELYYGYMPPEYRYQFRYYVAEFWPKHCSEARTLRTQNPIASLFRQVLVGQIAGNDCAFTRWTKKLQVLSKERMCFDDAILGGFSSLETDGKPTTFFLACQHDFREIIEQMLNTGWDINKPTSDGLTGLMFACYGGQKDLMSYLIGHGAKVTFSFNDQPLTPLFAAVRFAIQGDTDPLEFLLQQGILNGDLYVTQRILECTQEFDGLPKRISSNSVMWRTPNVVQNFLRIVLPHLPSIDLNGNIYWFMDYWGVTVTLMLLEKSKLPISVGTLCHIFEKNETYNDLTQILERILELDPEGLDAQCLNAALSRYRGPDPLRIFQYLREKNPSLSVTEETILSAAENDVHRSVFIQLLLKYNPSLKVSDKIFFGTINYPNIIQLFLNHDPDYRIPEYLVEKALCRGVRSSESILILLRQAPLLRIDQDSFHKILGGSTLNRETMFILFQRTPSVALTPELINSVGWTETLSSLLHLTVSSCPPEAINDELLKAVIRNYHRHYNREFEEDIIRCLEQLLLRAPKDLSPSDTTISLAMNSWPGPLVAFFRRFSSHLLNGDSWAFMKDLDTFETFLNAVPSMNITTAAINSFFEKGGHLSLAVLEKIFAHQPDLLITKDTLECAMINQIYPEAWNLMVHREPRIQVDEVFLLNILERYRKDFPSYWNEVMKQDPNKHVPKKLPALLKSRPLLRLSAKFLVEVCTFDDVTLVDVVLGKLDIQVIDESTMILIAEKCWPRALMAVASHKADVMVTEKVIMCLMQRLHKGNLDVKDTWRTTIAERAFVTLLERCPDLTDEERTERKWDLYDAVSEW